MEEKDNFRIIRRIAIGIWMLLELYFLYKSAINSNITGIIGEKMRHSKLEKGDCRNRTEYRGCNSIENKGSRKRVHCSLLVYTHNLKEYKQ